MSIVVVFDIKGGTQAQYEGACDKLTGGHGLPRTLAAWPVPGLISHAAAPTGEGWLVVDVWESQDAFDKFGAILGPVLGEVGMPQTEPRIYETFNVVT